jgi:aquaglyceroporin related protein
MATEVKLTTPADVNTATDIDYQNSPFIATGSDACDHKTVVWSRVRLYLREPFSEFFGTLIMVLLGNGVVAQVTLSRGQKGDYQSISWGWG